MPDSRICLVVASEMTVRAFLTPHLRALAPRYDVTVVANAADPGLLDSLGAPGRLVPIAIERPISPWRDLSALWRLYQLFRAERFDAVHSITPKAGLLAMLAATAARIPVRIHTFTGQVWATRRGGSRWLLRTLDKATARLATTTLADSPSQRDFLAAEGVRSRAPMIVLGKGSVKGVDPEVFKPDERVRHTLRGELALRDDDVLALFVGRLNRDKGVLDLAKAFGAIAAQCPTLRLLIVGPDEEGLRPAVEAACGAFLDRVVFREFTDRPQDFMAAADVLCLPSYREGVGTVTIEAAACGTAVIASRIYGITDAVEENVSALLHPVGDVGQLAEALRCLTRDPQLRRSLGAAGRERAVREFHVDKLTSAQLALYGSLLGDGGVASETPSACEPGGLSAEPRNGGWYRRRGKRLLDVTVAAAGLLVLSPLLACVALVVRAGLGTPVLFRQRRPGLHGVPFTLVKFRTMTDRYDQHGGPLPDGDRLTAVGRFLRAASLDELPELWNVLKGDMSLVGPRPLLMEYLTRYSPRQARRHSVKPGITGLAQVNGRNELPWPERLDFDVAYTEQVSLALDLRILTRTVLRVAARRGISQPGHATAQKFSGVEGR